MRLVFWNIQAGGGKRIEGIARQLIAWSPTIIALAEFRGTAASQWLANYLYQQGWQHQLTTVNPALPAANALLCASIYPLEQIAATTTTIVPTRWLLTKVLHPTAPFTLGVMHIPNMVTGLKYPFYQGLLSLLDGWTHEQGLLIGDTNSGLPKIDEESPAFTKLEAGWIGDMERRGWHDMYRVLHGDARTYTWYSPNGRNGFRLDQAFANPTMLPRITALRYEWGAVHPTPKGERYLSDHAAILVDLDITLPVVSAKPSSQ